MSHWIDTPKPPPVLHSAAVDAVFRINCVRLPVDNAALLCAAITDLAPWLADHPGSGIHPLHVAAAQNGWQPPDANTDDQLHLSRRTRLIIRIDRRHYQQLLDSLTGKGCLIGKQPLQFVSARQREISPSDTLYARHVHFSTVSDADSQAKHSETAFTARITEQCRHSGFEPLKLLCGRSSGIRHTDGRVMQTRSVLLADVPPQASIKLQTQGLGDDAMLGCGVLTAYKSIAAI